MTDFQKRFFEFQKELSTLSKDIKDKTDEINKTQNQSEKDYLMLETKRLISYYYSRQDDFKRFINRTLDLELARRKR